MCVGVCVCELVGGMSTDNTGVTGFLSKSNSITLLLARAAEYFIVTLSQNLC